MEENIQTQNQNPETQMPQEPAQPEKRSFPFFSKPILLIAVLAIILIIALVALFSKDIYAPTPSDIEYPAGNLSPTTTPSEEPVINDEQGLNDALQTVDSQNPDSLDADVSQNEQDASSFY